MAESNTTTVEVWKSVVGYEGLYSVSNCGQVSSTYNGGRILKLCVHGMGYYAVTLTKDKRHITKYVHRLVAAAFFGECPVGIVCNHKNGNKLDNRVENLEYCTPKENVNHARQTGLLPPRTHSKLTIEDVRQIRKKYAEGGITYKELAEHFHVDFSLIYQTIKRKAWKYVE